MLRKKKGVADATPRIKADRCNRYDSYPPKMLHKSTSNRKALMPAKDHFKYFEAQLCVAI